MQNQVPCKSRSCTCYKHAETCTRKHKSRRTLKHHKPLPGDSSPKITRFAISTRIRVRELSCGTDRHKALPKVRYITDAESPQETRLNKHHLALCETPTALSTRHSAKEQKNNPTQTWKTAMYQECQIIAWVGDDLSCSEVIERASPLTPLPSVALRQLGLLERVWPTRLP